MDLQDIVNIASNHNLVVIGGPSRSGKTTVAERISSGLLELGKTSALINIDSYLGGPGYQLYRKKPLGYFPIAQEMEMKFDYERVADDIKRILSGDELFLPVYDRPTRTRIQERADKAMLPADVIILEGTPALAVPGLLPLPSLRLFVTADATERGELLMKDWMETKGLSEEEAQDLLDYRRSGEEPFIHSTVASAHYLISRKASVYEIWPTRRGDFVY